MPTTEKKKQVEVHAKCRRGSDNLTLNQSCDSLTAFQLSEPGSRTASFKCKKCGHAWHVPLGGAFSGA